MQFWKKSIKKSGLNFYTSIDNLPVRIWFDIHKDADFSLLLIDVKDIDEDDGLELFMAWEEMYNQYISRFGLSDEFMIELRNEVKMANLQADFIITGQRHLRTLINIEKEKIRLHNLESNKPLELESLLAKMSKYYGFKLSSRELTVAEYYSYLNNITDGKAS